VDVDVDMHVVVDVDGSYRLKMIMPYKSSYRFIDPV
jgi:hypothetical protein